MSEITPGSGTYNAVLRVKADGVKFDEHKIVLADSKDEARKKVLEYLKDFFGPNTDQLGGETFCHPDGTPIIYLYGIGKVESFDDLVRMLGIID